MKQLYVVSTGPGDPNLLAPQAKMAIYFAKNVNSMNRALVGYSNHYHATWMKKRPYWAKGQKPVKVIGQHAFYKL